MSDKKYRICLYVPLGKRDGTLSLHESDGRITGYMDILNQKSDIVRTLCSDGHLELCGVLKTLMTTVPFNAVGTIDGNRIILNLNRMRCVLFSLRRGVK